MDTLIIPQGLLICEKTRVKKSCDTVPLGGGGGVPGTGIAPC